MDRVSCTPQVGHLNVVDRVSIGAPLWSETLGVSVRERQSRGLPIPLLFPTCFRHAYWLTLTVIFPVFVSAYTLLGLDYLLPFRHCLCISIHFSYSYKCLCWCGAIPPHPNTPSWCGTQLKHRDDFTFTCFLFFLWMCVCVFVCLCERPNTHMGKVW
jgi:hypothetical protein